MAHIVLQNPALLDNILAQSTAPRVEIVTLARVNQDFFGAVAKRLYRNISSTLYLKLTGPTIEYSNSARLSIYLDAVRSVTYSTQALLEHCLPYFTSNSRRNITALIVTNGLSVGKLPKWQSAGARADARIGFTFEIRVNPASGIIDESLEVFLLCPQVNKETFWTLMIPYPPRTAYPSKYKVRRRLLPRFVAPGSDLARTTWMTRAVEKIAVHDLDGDRYDNFPAPDPKKAALLKRQTMKLKRLEIHHPSMKDSDFRLMSTVTEIEDLTLTVPNESASIESLLPALRCERPSRSTVSLQTESIDNHLCFANLPELLMKVGRTPWLKSIHLSLPLGAGSMAKLKSACKLLDTGSHVQSTDTAWSIDLQLAMDMSGERAMEVVKLLESLLIELGLESSLRHLRIRIMASIYVGMIFTWGRTGMLWSGSLPMADEDDI